jgi:hypothetical protein
MNIKPSEVGKIVNKASGIHIPRWSTPIHSCQIINSMVIDEEESKLLTIDSHRTYDERVQKSSHHQRIHKHIYDSF